MNLKPSENPNLYGMNNFFNEIISLYNIKKMPTKILLSGKKGLGKSTLAYHIINYVFSKNEDFKYDSLNHTINENNKSFILLKNYSHPNFYLIDLLNDKKTIDIAQVREMITYTSKSVFDNMSRFILIDNIEKLNKNSINALLKIVEEPNDNVFFILIDNNEKYILPTLKSRCLTFKINFSFNQSIDISNQILKKDIFSMVNHDLINNYSTPGEIINLINFSKDKNMNLKDHTLISLLNILIDNKHYRKNKLAKYLLFNFIEMFFIREYRLTKAKKSLLDFYHHFIIKIHNMEKFNLDEESLFLEFKSKLLNG